jgi:hypothetical protein
MTRIAKIKKFFLFIYSSFIIGKPKLLSLIINPVGNAVMDGLPHELQKVKALALDNRQFLLPHTIKYFNLIYLDNNDLERRISAELRQVAVSESEVCDKKFRNLDGCFKAGIYYMSGAFGRERPV